jgi:hypothetical protein
VRPKKLYLLLACTLFALILLNPDEERHRAVLMDNAQARFFDLSPEYQQIFQQVRSSALRGKNPSQLRYSNFLIFSALNHTEASPTHTGNPPRTRLLTMGALGFVVPVTF